jgi:hypothetical protein
MLFYYNHKSFLTCGSSEINFILAFGIKKLDLQEQVGVVEAALLYFNFIFPKTQNYFTHQNFSRDEVIKRR